METATICREDRRTYKPAGTSAQAMKRRKLIHFEDYEESTKEFRDKKFNEMQRYAQSKLMSLQKEFSGASRRSFAASINIIICLYET